MNALYSRWQQLFKDPQTRGNEEYEWSTNELRNQLRSIDWDLEDLDETISIVEKHPQKFQLDRNEVNERKQFIAGTRDTVRKIRQELNNAKSVTGSGGGGDRGSRAGGKGKGRGYDRYQKLDEELASANDDFIGRQQQEQQLIMNEQDVQLDQVGKTVGVLKNIGQEIGRELEEQNVMLDDFDHEMDRTDSRLKTTLKKLDKVLDASKDKKQCCLILVLILILTILIIVYFTV